MTVALRSVEARRRSLIGADFDRFAVTADGVVPSKAPASKVPHKQQMIRR